VAIKNRRFQPRRWTDTNSKPDTDSDANCYTNSYTNCYTNSYSNGDPEAHADTKGASDATPSADAVSVIGVG